ncbi:CS1 type fimbrial major subunit [Burkholderia anthina]|uniref:CS1 type fimbrial major subunit n=1 Tax=Burkholderia anthina TaxID=179879 RepID=UPI00075F5FA8|nr:CS1 type fimbrial major subunit [Burkholderia anthina]KVE00331.1 hypothetical protein WS65_27555 [Burkholderia anthina]
MKTSRHLVALAVSIALIEVAHAGQTSPQAVVKTIRLTAHIGDILFVSQPDDPAYGLVELNDTDGKQQTFAAALPIHVRTTNPDINVTLLQPLRFSNGRDDMAHAKVVLTGKASSAEIAPGAAHALVATTRGRDGYDETRMLKVSAQAPAASAAPPARGSYRGDLTLVFEPAASAGREPATAPTAVAGE